MMKQIFNTERLYLRDVEASDLDFLAKLHRDPKVMQYIGPPRTRKSVKERIARIRQAYIDYPGRGIWMACQKEDDAPIGWGCLKDLDGNEEIEIGYRLATSFWGKGYATELARGLVKYGFEQYGLEEIVGVTTPDNIGSQKVLEKAGLEKMGMAIHYNTEVFYYELSKSKWLKTQEIQEIGSTT